jgi:hypothetical protein
MDLTKLNDASDQLDEKNKKAILDVINLKVEDDMEKILSKIDSKFEHIESKISTGYWVVGISTAVISILIAAMSILLTIIAFKK